MQVFHQNHFVVDGVNKTSAVPSVAILINLSSQGACVSCAPGLLANLPDQFDLTFDNCHTFCCCEVIWRSKIARQFGVVWRLS
jgi:hypothetical protein